MIQSDTSMTCLFIAMFIALMQEQNLRGNDCDMTCLMMKQMKCSA